MTIVLRWFNTIVKVMEKRLHSNLIHIQICCIKVKIYLRVIMLVPMVLKRLSEWRVNKISEVLIYL